MHLGVSAVLVDERKSFTYAAGALARAIDRARAHDLNAMALRRPIGTGDLTAPATNALALRVPLRPERGARIAALSLVRRGLVIPELPARH